MILEHAVADVLEKLALYIEADQAEKEAAETAKRQELVSGIRQKVSEVIGQDLDDDIIDKLANADPEVLRAFGKLAEGADVSALGSPSMRKTASAPLNKNEAVEVAGENLVNFCIG